MIVAREAKLNHDWMLASAVQALVANCNRSKNQPPYDVYHFHPYLKRPPRQISDEELRSLFGVKDVGKRG